MNFGYKIDKINKTVDLFFECKVDSFCTNEQPCAYKMRKCGEKNTLRLSYVKFDEMIKDIMSLRN